MSEPLQKVFLSQGAEQSMEAIYDYLAKSDFKANADYLVDAMMVSVENGPTSLSEVLTRKNLAARTYTMPTSILRTVSHPLPRDRPNDLHCRHCGG